MGQKYGKCVFKPEIMPLCCLSRCAIMSLSSNFNELSENFGLGIFAFLNITKSLNKYIECSMSKQDNYMNTIFQIFDTDKNNLVDGFEFIGSLAFISGMSLEEKILFIIRLYDFESNQEYPVVAIILAIKTIMNGLSKISLEFTISEYEIQTYIYKVFPNTTSETVLQETIIRNQLLTVNIK